MVFMLKKLDAYGAPLRSLTINPRDVFNMGHLFELLLPALGSVRFEDMDLYIFHLINLEYPGEWSHPGSHPSLVLDV